jgi:ATP-dependent DNA helicase RecG
MPLPININELINGTTVEWERIEFKEGWNDLDILHTICAFANDFSNLGGGYVIVGIAEKDGRPILPPKGLTPEQADKIQKELLNLCKQRLKPDYTPIVEPVTFQGKLILIIWCPGGQERPYEAPESFAKGVPVAKHYFIRKFSNTVKPNKTEKEELLRFAAVPYDDRVNHKYSLNDLSQGLVRSFLQEIKSKLLDDFDKLSFIEVCRQMNLVEGSNEYVKPKNFALMFFNDHPEKIFSKAQIEIVSFQTPIADKNFTEINLEGPIHHQLRDALRYLKTQVIKEIRFLTRQKLSAILIFHMKLWKKCWLMLCITVIMRQTNQLKSGFIQTGFM